MAKVLKGDFTRKKKTDAQGASSDKPIPGYQLKIAVTFSDPLIWRRVRVPGTMTLSRLHRTIQACMGWNDTDTHQFLVGKIFYQAGFGIEKLEKKSKYDEAKFELHQLEEGMQFIFTYLYDGGGDGWELELTLEEVLLAGFEGQSPVLLAGERACPPENVGDIHEYQTLLTTSEQVGNGSRKTFNIPTVSEFDPEECDLESIKTRLSTII